MIVIPTFLSAAVLSLYVALTSEVGVVTAMWGMLAGCSVTLAVVHYFRRVSRLNLDS